MQDDRKHFEFLMLEAAQAGLSWDTVLRKRENYRAAFANFDPVLVSQFGASQLEAMMQNPGLIRNRAKLSSAISNAGHFLAIQEEFGSFNAYIWRLVDGTPICNAWRSMDEIPATSPVSDALSKDLKKRGFKFVGSTICYAHLQAAGLVNDHLIDCCRYKQIQDNYAG